MAEKRTTSNVIGPLYRYMKDNADMVIHLSDMRSDLDLNPTSIDSAINRMVANPEYRVVRGPVKGTYMYKSAGLVEPVAKPVLDYGPQIAQSENVRINTKQSPEILPHVFEHIGQLNNAAILLRRDDGLMYVAMTLDSYISGKP